MPTPRKYATNAERQAAYRARCAASPSPTGPRTPPRPGSRRWTALLRHAQTVLELVREEMAVYAAERSDAWQDSDRGEVFQERLALVEEAMSLLCDLAEA